MLYQPFKIVPRYQLQKSTDVEKQNGQTNGNATSRGNLVSLHATQDNSHTNLQRQIPL